MRILTEGCGDQRAIWIVTLTACGLLLVLLGASILMFVICSLVLIVVSLMTPAPDRKKLAGLTFATVDDKMDTVPVAPTTYKPAAETALEHKINVIFSLLLVATVVGLWIYFR